MPRKIAKTACSGPCARDLPPDAFSENPRLVGGRSPWCRECVTDINVAGAEGREEYHKAYQKAYHAQRAEDNGGAKRPSWHVATATGRARVVLSRVHGTLRVTTSWRAREDALSLAKRLGGENLEMSGQGGGSGRGRKHRGTVVRGSVDVGRAEGMLEKDETARRMR